MVDKVWRSVDATVVQFSYVSSFYTRQKFSLGAFLQFKFFFFHLSHFFSSFGPSSFRNFPWRGAADSVTASSTNSMRFLSLSLLRTMSPWHYHDRSSDNVLIRLQTGMTLQIILRTTIHQQPSLIYENNRMIVLIIIIETRK